MHPCPSCATERERAEFAIVLEGDILASVKQAELGYHFAEQQSSYPLPDDDAAPAPTPSLPPPSLLAASNHRFGVSLIIDLFAGSSSTIHLDDGSVTAADLAVDGKRLAGTLAAKGLEPGDRIAVWASNGLPFLRCLTAAAAGRFVLVAINTRFGPDEAWSIINRSGATLLVTDRDLERSPGTVMVIPAGDIESILNHKPVATNPQPDDPFIVFTTSGTTSQPKLVLQTQQSIADHAADIPRVFGYDNATRVMVALPLCGVFGISSLTGALAGNSEIWLPQAFDANTTSAVVEHEQITAMNGADDMFHRMLQTDFDLSSIGIGGYARFNPSLTNIVSDAEKRGVTLTGVYGMSEVQALYSLQDPTLPAERRAPGGGALVSPIAGARVVDPDTGQVAEVGVDGELQLHGPSLFAGYLNEGGDGINVGLTEGAHAIDQDGIRWFRTGDLARMEPDGTFTYLTRMGDVLRLGGFLVSPAEIEDALIDVPSISEAQVVAVARPEGVRPVAVVIGSGEGDIDEAAIKAHCLGRLASFKVPIRIIEVDAFPVTQSANGTKIQRNKIQELAEQALAQASG